MMTINLTRSSRRGVARIAPVAAMMITAFTGCEHPVPPLSRGVAASTAAKPTTVVGGEMIYLRGEGPSGQKISARISDGPELPATTLACVHCHGRDGRGRPEGGVTPSDIRWENLTRRRGGARPGERRRPAYTEALLARAVTMGWDSAGQSLSVAMPRYKIATADMAGLIAYIQNIEGTPVPGVDASSVRIGIALPDESPETSRNREILETVSEYLKKVNQSGTIFRRRINLGILKGDRPDDPEVFAALSGFTSEGDPRSERIEAAQIPSVRLYPTPTRLRPNDCRESFALLSGQAGQVRALARFAVERRIGFDSGIAVLHRSGDRAGLLAREVAAQFRAAGAKIVVVNALPSSPDEIALLSERRISAIVLAGPVDSTAFHAYVRMIGLRSKPITILAPAVVANPRFTDEITGLPTHLLIASSAQTGKGTGTSEVLAAAKLLVEGLKEAGRDLDRESFIEAMERVSSHAIHDAIQVAFGPGRRVGSRGATIFRLNQNGSGFEVVAQRIDPGPRADDWPEDSGQAQY